jgi:hypothetical protein
MAALNFVAVEDGLEEDPKLGTLQRILKVERPTAFWYVVRLRRLILHHGNHLTGALPKRFSDDDIASFLEFSGRPRKLVDALKRQGFLGRRSGRGYAYPDWLGTITGRYASQRESDRLYHEKQRVERRRSGDVGRQSDDASADSRATSSDIPGSRNKERNPAGPPVPPPEGGQALGATRWDWLMNNAPTPQNREVCVRYLAAMSADDWALMQFAYETKKRGTPGIGVRNARTLAWPTDTFIRKTAYLRFSSHWRAFKNASNDPAKAEAKKASEREPTHEEKQASAWAFLQAFLADPDWPEREKDKRKAHFAKQWGARPWEQ